MGIIRVVVPVFKVEKTLCRCIDSILSQTFSDFELILVDDGSPDSCPAICDAYAKKDPRVHVLHQQNKGISAARNAGVSFRLERSCHKWITFIDSDDLIHPQMLELLYYAAEKHSADISMCTALECESVPTDFYRCITPVISRHLVSERYIISLYHHESHRYWTAWAKLFRRELVESMPFEVGRYYEDNNLIFKLLSSANVVADVDACMYAYIINNTGITKSGFSLKQLDFLYALRTQIQFYEHINYLDIKRLICTRYILNSVNIYIKIRDVLKDYRHASQLRWHIIWFWLKNRSEIDMPLDKAEYYLAMLSPTAAKLHSYNRVFKQVVKENGMSGVIKKVFIRKQK